VTATLLSETPLPRLPSASGVEIIGPTAYVVSDDAPFLYLLDAATLASAGQVALFASTEFGTGRLPKAGKPDFESMTAIVAPTKATGLLLCGSGALPPREMGYFVGLPAPTAAPTEAAHRFVQRLDLSQLYAQLRKHLPADATLNIEAMAATASELLLLQRPIGGGPALVFELPLAATLAHLFEPRLPVPAPRRVLPFTLPLLGGYAAGFSGATLLQGRLLVSASVEATADAVADGATLGSFIGHLDLGARTATFARLTWADGRAYLGKVEGLAVRRALGPNQWELLLVTDDDRGGSTGLLARLQLP
jgi:hypothetical protein